MLHRAYAASSSSGLKPTSAGQGAEGRNPGPVSKTRVPAQTHFGDGRFCACFLRGFAQLRVLVAPGAVAEVTVATALNCSLRRRLGQPFGRTLRAVAHLWLGTLLERWSGPRRLWPGRPTTITTPCCCSPDLPGRPRRRPETYDRSRRLCSVHARKCRHFTSLP